VKDASSADSDEDAMVEVVEDSLNANEIVGSPPSPQRKSIGKDVAQIKQHGALRVKYLSSEEFCRGSGHIQKRPPFLN
jgi:hypothetical protein